MTQNRQNREKQQQKPKADHTESRFTVRNWMLVFVVFCQFATVLITWQVWRVRDHPLNLPLFQFLEPFGEQSTLNALGPLLILSLVLVLVRPRPGIIVHASIYLVACLFDQYRLQPQFFSLIVLMCACVYAPGVWFARWYLASMWIWTGIHKLLSEEWLGVVSYDFLGNCGIRADGWNQYFAIAIGAFEVVLGLLAIIAPRKAIPLCIAVHLGILLSLSPLFANHNESVWPWNLATAVVGAWILSQVPARPRTRLRYVVVATLLIVPLGYFFNLVNSRLCFVLYSGDLPKAMHASQERLKRLDGWTGLEVPFPNSPRLFVQVFDRTSQPGDKLYVSDPRHWVSDRFFLKATDGTVQEISRERFYRDDPSNGEARGIEFDSKNAVWQLREAGALLVEDEHQMVSSANLKGNHFGDREFTFLRQLPNLRELKAENTRVSDRGLKALAGLRRLEILEIQGGHLTNECLAVVKALNALNWLRLEDLEIESDGLRSIRKLPQIQTLHLPNTSVNDRALAHIGTLTNLQWLDLSDTNVTGKRLHELESLKNLDWINLSDTAVDNAALEYLGQLERLEIVQLAHTKVSDDGLAALSKLRECRTLDLESTNITDAGLPYLTALINLQMLNLRGTRVSKEGVEKLQAKMVGLRIDW